MGLYGGLTVADIHENKGLKKNEKILDFMGSTELIANLFRISQTEEKLKRDGVSSATAANNTHYEVAEKVREAIIQMGATLPEDLPTPAKSIQEVEREELRKLRRSNPILMLDE
jgi:DNA-damage-inducible protein D